MAEQSPENTFFSPSPAPIGSRLLAKLADFLVVDAFSGVLLVGFAVLQVGGVSGTRPASRLISLFGPERRSEGRHQERLTMKPVGNRKSTPHYWKLLPSALCLLMAPCLFAQGQDENNSRAVVLTVRGPSGRLLKDHAVTLSRIGFPPPNIPAVSTTTNSQGRVTVMMPVGFVRLRVLAPGVGYGMTGSVEVGLGQETQATLPPLAPFARLSGTIAPALRRPGETLFLVDPYSDGRQLPQRVPVDAQGRFALSDLPAGQVGLQLDRGDAGQNLYFYYYAAPGENKTSVVLALSRTGFSFPPYVPLPVRAITLRGHVTNDHGKPVFGATVYAKFPAPNPPMAISSPSSLFDDPAPLSTVTTEDGSYVFRDVGVSSYGSSAALIVPIAAAAPAHPPALTAARIEWDRVGEVSAEIVLSTQHTRLGVHVMAPDGKPAAGIKVDLRPSAGLSGIVAAPPGDRPLSYFSAGPGSIPDAMSRLFTLSGTTGADGTVQFTDIVPGFWDVEAADPQAKDTLLPLSSARSRAIAVQAGLASSCTLALAPRPFAPTVQVLSPKGNPVAVDGVMLEPGSRITDTRLFSELTSSELTFSELTSTAEDNAPLPALSEKPGLWRITANYREAAGSSGYYTSIPEPYNAAGALVALSPALPPPGILRLRARHRTAGVLRVRLEGLDGRPAAGTVVILGSPAEPGYAATVNSHGEAVFTEMPAGTYSAAGRLSGQQTSPTLSALSSGDDAPLPTDAALSGQVCIAPQQADIALETETQIVLRAAPAGFVRGRIVPAAGVPLNAYLLMPYYLPGTGEAKAAGIIDLKTGAFVYGPLPPGPATLNLECQEMTLRKSIPIRAISTSVPPGKVVSVGSITAPPLPSRSGPEVVLGRVFLSDGTTPAWNAQVVLFSPSPFSPEYPKLTAQTPADALGYLTGAAAPTAGGFYSGEGPPLPSPPEQNPAVPTLVAWLPGLTGAALLFYTPGQTVRIVLPPACTATGRVTIGGKSAAGLLRTLLLGTLRVRAEYQKRGRLNDLLSRDVTCQPDGTFTLNGLTPGTYLVQAARDGIWLSASQTVIVGDAPVLPLALDIAPPGLPVTLHLSPGAAVSLDRPAGPLTDLLWPAVIRADGIGDLRLEGLEAGRHFVQPVTGGPRVEFDVPPVGAAAPAQTPK